MMEAHSPGQIRGLCTPEREQDQVWTGSPALPAWRPELQHWPQVEAWQASCEDGLPWCSIGSRDLVEFTTEDLEEIDRFLNGLQVSSGAASSASKSTGSEVCSQNDQNVSVRSERSNRCSFNFRKGTQEISDLVHGEMQEEVPDEPMERCSQCGRSFWARRLQVHESVCKGARPEARRIFESRQQRLRGLPKVEVKSSKTPVTSKPKHPEKQSGNALCNRRAEQPKAEQPKVSPTRRMGKRFTTPVKPTKPKPKASPASPVSVPSQRSRLSGRTKELDTPPRIEKREASRAKAATVPIKELPEVRWCPEEVAELRCWAFSEETVPWRRAESLCQREATDSDQEDRFFESSELQSNFRSEETSLPAESGEMVWEEVARHEPTVEEEASEASELFNGWIQQSVRAEDLKSDKDSDMDPEFELLRPDDTDNTSRLALVSEAAALCAQVDAMLEGERTAEKSQSLEFGDQAQNHPNILGPDGPDEADPFVPSVPYDPSKYIEDLADVTSSLCWLKRCANQIQQRRCEFERWQSSAFQK